MTDETPPQRPRTRQRKSKIRRRSAGPDPPPVPWKRAAIAFAILAFLASAGLLICLVICSDTP